jgi:hypothetical protein
VALSQLGVVLLVVDFIPDNLQVLHIVEIPRSCGLGFHRNQRFDSNYFYLDIVT